MKRDDSELASAISFVLVIDIIEFLHRGKGLDELDNSMTSAVNHIVCRKGGCVYWLLNLNKNDNMNDMIYSTTVVFRIIVDILQFSVVTIARSMARCYALA